MLGKSEVSDECKCVVKGLFTKMDDDLTQVITNLISTWNDPNIKPEFICDVQRGLTYGKGDGKHNLFVTAVDAQSCAALIAGAQQYMSASDGIIWSTFSQSRVCESFIEGLLPQSDRNVTQVVKELVHDWNDSEITPDFIEKAIIDKRNGKDLVVVTATTPQNSRALVKAAKRHLSANNQMKWFFTRNFQNN